MKPTFKKYYFEETAKINGRISLNDALSIAGEIAEKLDFKYISPDKIGPNTKFIKNIIVPVGSIRRQKPDIGDIDLVCTGDIDAYDVERIKGVEKVWARGEKQIYFNYHANNGLWRSINIFVLDDPGSFGAFMMHTTGSNVFNIITRRHAKKYGMKLNQYELSDATTGENIAGDTEGSIFKALNMNYIQPNARIK